MIAAPTIIEAASDPALWKPLFRDGETWRPWFTMAKALFGLPLDEPETELFRQCTGRAVAPATRAKEAWLIVGRRGGKSRVLALVAAYLAVFVDWSPYLVAGERGVITVLASDRRQCRVIMNYLRAFLLDTPLLHEMVIRDSAEEIELANGLIVEVVTCSFRAVRGRTNIVVLGDEIAFWADEDGKNPGSEVIGALRPAMATIPDAMLLVASSPYARRGPLYDAWKRYYGKDGRILVWQAPTWIMNPKLPRESEVIADAYEADPANADAEYGGQFRRDIETYVAAEVIEAAIVSGRFELPPASGIRYLAACDPSGGTADSFTLAIVHAEKNKFVVDVARERRAPFAPDEVTREFATLLKTYGLSSVTGDRYAGMWPTERFRVHGVTYNVAESPKSDLYRDLLPLLNSERVELLDLPRLANQFRGLERRTSRGGKDSIDHAPGLTAADDLSNAVASALVHLARKRGPLVISDAVLARAAQPGPYFRPRPVGHFPR